VCVCVCVCVCETYNGHVIRLVSRRHHQVVHPLRGIAVITVFPQRSILCFSVG